MTTQEASQRLQNKINGYSAAFIKKLLLDLVKPSQDYSDEDHILRYHLLDVYESKTSEDEVDALLDILESIEWPA